MKLNKCPKTLVVVHWADAWHGGNRYYEDDGDHTPMAMQSVGFLMEENDETVVLCGDYCPDDGQFRKQDVIPLCNVIEIWEINYK